MWGLSRLTKVLDFFFLARLFIGKRFPRTKIAFTASCLSCSSPPVWSFCDSPHCLGNPYYILFPHYTIYLKFIFILKIYLSFYIPSPVPLSSPSPGPRHQPPILPTPDPFLRGGKALVGKSTKSGSSCPWDSCWCHCHPPTYQVTHIQRV